MNQKVSELREKFETELQSVKMLPNLKICVLRIWVKRVA